MISFVEKKYSILDPNSLILNLYPRLNCLKTILSQMAPIYGRTPASNFPVRIYGSLLQEKLSEKKALNFVELMFCQEKARRNNATTRARANSSTATAGTVTTTAASTVSRTTGT